jgi:hypothetical protein
VKIIYWYKYLFYRIYQWRVSRPKTFLSQPEIDATLLVALANMLYVVGALFLFTAFSRRLPSVLFEDFGKTKVVVYCLAVVFALAHLYGYVWSGNSKKIIKDFEMRKNTKIGTFSVIFYIVFSYLFFIGTGFFLWPSINAWLPHF